MTRGLAVSALFIISASLVFCTPQSNLTPLHHPRPSPLALLQLRIRALSQVGSGTSLAESVRAKTALSAAAATQTQTGARAAAGHIFLGRDGPEDDGDVERNYVTKFEPIRNWLEARKVRSMADWDKFEAFEAKEEHRPPFFGPGAPIVVQNKANGTATDQRPHTGTRVKVLRRRGVDRRTGITDEQLKDWVWTDMSKSDNGTAHAAEERPKSAPMPVWTSDGKPKDQRTWRQAAKEAMQNRKIARPHVPTRKGKAVLARQAQYVNDVRRLDDAFLGKATGAGSYAGLAMRQVLPNIPFGMEAVFGFPRPKDD